MGKYISCQTMIFRGISRNSSNFYLPKVIMISIIKSFRDTSYNRKKKNKIDSMMSQNVNIYLIKNLACG